MNNRTGLILFTALFLDLCGFGIVLPLLAVYVDELGATGWQIGAIVSSYPLVQIFLIPFWGRLSDRLGRRPVLLACFMGSTLSYLVFALGSSDMMEGWTGILVILLSRILAGFFGAALAVVSASIADQTDHENRTGGMALFGMAFGLGFIVGPLIGSLSLQLLGNSGPGLAAGTICGLNLLMAFFFLPETLRKEGQRSRIQTVGDQWRAVMGNSRIRILVVLLFLAAICFTCFEVIFALLLENYYDYTRSQLGYFLAWAGVITLMVYPWIGRLSRRFGDPLLLVLGLLGLGLSTFMLPRAPDLGMLLAVIAIFSVFSALTRTPIHSMISKAASPQEQGAVMGVSHSVTMLARLLVPSGATALFHFDAQLPFTVAGAMCIVVAILAWLSLFPSSSRQPGA